MAIEVKMPRLSLTMESGVVLEWRKSVGEAVRKGEELAEIETDKASVALESPATGYVRRLLVPLGEDVPCDTALAILTATADESLGDPAGSESWHAAVAGPMPGASAPAEARSPAEPAAPPEGRGHVNASPAAKHLARELAVDIATIQGTGPGGRIGLEDVQRAADARTAAPAPRSERRLPITKMRAAIAQSMVLSATTVPQFTVRRRVDLTAALRLRDTLASGETPSPGLVDVLHLATVRALRRHPEVNAGFEAGETMYSSHIVLHDAVNLGFALALPDGLLVPVIRDAHDMSVEHLAAARGRLQDAARTNGLSARELSGATFTVSNLGALGVDEFEALVNPPEAAILAVGRLRHDLVVRDGAIHTLPMMTLTVTADHRILDGAQVAAFLDTLARYLDQPEALGP